MESYSPNYSATTLILDGAHAVRRGMYAPNTRSLSNNQGVPTGGIFSFFNSLKSTISSIRANALVVIWEGGHSERRNAIYPEYKDRHIDPDAPPELDQFGMTDYQYYGHQLSWIQKILEYYGIPQLCVPGKEGDDTLYQATRLLRGHKVIVSEDRDFFSLVSDDIACYRPIKKEYVELGSFQRITGYKSPRHFLYGKCMLGDGSDNIPAVAKGVGEGTVLSVLDRIEDPEEVTTSRILKEAASFHKTRHDKLVAAGEQAINRNLDLIDISRESFDIFQLKSLVETLEKQVYPDTVMTTKLFRALDFSQDTINFINNSLVNMSTFPISQLVDKSYLKKVVMFGTSILGDTQ